MTLWTVITCPGPTAGIRGGITETEEDEEGKKEGMKKKTPGES